MGECIARFYINNGEFQNCSDFVTSELFEGESVYEVIRVIDMVPLFFEDHYKRLENSAMMIGLETGVSSSGLLDMVMQLILKNDLKNGNLKIFINFTGDTRELYLFIIESQYPDPEMYSMGVPAIFYYAERRNPTAKIFNHRMRSAIYERLIMEGAYEALLVNKNNFITEGSRSNIFVIFNDTVVTAPDEFVLSGITRQYMFKICSDLHTNLELRLISKEEVQKADAVFMTGTSPHILGISRIDNISFKVDHPVTLRLSEAYREKVSEYIKERRKV